MRSSRVVSRNREIRPASAAARSAPPASVSANSPSTGGSSPTIRISSRSTVTSGAADEPAVGQPAREPGGGVVGAGQVGLLPTTPARSAAAARPVPAPVHPSAHVDLPHRSPDYEITPILR